MTEVDGGREFSGPAWPPGSGALVDTSRCPSCFTPITATPCVSCGLNLADSRTARVLELSQRIVELVDERTDVLLRVYRDAAVAEAAAAAAPAPAAGERTPTMSEIPPGFPAPAGPAPTEVPRAPAATDVAATTDAAAAAPVAAEPSAAASAPVAATEVVFAPPSGAPVLPVPLDPSTAPAAASAHAPAAAPMPPTPTPVPPFVGGPPSAVAAPTASPPAASPPPASPPAPSAPAKPRRSSVQVFLLSVGVVLLAVAAAFFLTVAWISGGLVLRSIIIGLVTAAIVAAASILRRRGLGATAEGIALLGIAFVALDVWAVRANDLGGAMNVEPRVFWGVTSIVAGGAFVGWARLSRLRAPLSTAVVSLAIGPAVLVTGLVERDAALGGYAGGLALLVVALAAPLAPLLARRPRPALAVEIAVVRGLAAVGAAVALTAALLVDPRSTVTPALLSAALAVALALHAHSLARRGAARLAPTAAVLSVLVLGVGVAASAVRTADAALSATVPVLIAAALALGLDAAARRATPGVGRTTVVTAAWAAALAAALAAVVPFFWALTAFGAPVRSIISTFGQSAVDITAPDATSTAAVIALAAIVALAAVVWRLSGSWPQRRSSALIAAATVALLVGPQLRVLLLVVGWYLVLAVVALIVLRRRRGDIALAAVAGSMALGIGWLLSFSSPLAWGLASIVVAAVLAAAAGVHPGLRVPSTVSVVLFVSGSAPFVPPAMRIGADVVIEGFSLFIASLVMASLCLIVLVLPLARGVGLTAAQRQSGIVSALAVIAAVGPLALLFRTGVAADVWILASAAVSAGASAAVLTAPYRSWRVARPAAALLSPLLVAGAAGAALRLVDAAPLARVVVLAAIALVVAAAALRLLRADALTRAFLDAGTAIVVALSIADAPSQGVRWIPLLLAAVTAMIWATDVDGLFRSRGPRRHLVWLALLLGTLALWTRLFWQQTDAVEAFTVPVGVALLALAAGHERARRLVDGRSVAGPAVIAAAGITVALAPSALATPDDAVRTLVVGAVSASVLVAGAWVRPARTPDELPVAVAASGALALVLLTVSQLGHAAGRGGIGLADLVLMVTAVAIGVAARGVARRPAPWAPASARIAAVTAAAILALGSTALVAADGGPIVRTVGAIVVLGALGVGALRSAPPLLGIPLSIAGLGGAGLVAVAGVGVDVRPIEWMTIPLALAWIAAALLERRRPITPPFVLLAAAGLAVGMLPSAVLADTSPARAIGVAVAAIAVLVGAVLLLRHAFASLLTPVIAVAGLALIVAASLRALRELATPLFDIWMLLATVPLAGVAVLLLRRRAAVASWMPVVLALAAPSVAVALTLARLSATGEGAVRLVVTLVAVLALGLWWRGRIVFWAVIALSTVLALTAMVLGSADPVEAATAPLAAAVVFHGIRALHRHPELRTWPALGIGLGLLLVPSLLFDFGADNALWRVLALGVVALAVLLIGARLRWQAPVLLGGVVLIVHAVAQLWPGITALYESATGLWWLWLGIAGVLLIVVAATYERRIREVKAVALAIRSLR